MDAVHSSGFDMRRPLDPIRATTEHSFFPHHEKARIVAQKKGIVASFRAISISYTTRDQQKTTLGSNPAIRNEICYSCLAFWGLGHAYSSEWNEQRISMPLGAIDTIGGGSYLHMPFVIWKWMERDGGQ
jgi:hypothetical protein